MKTHLKRAALAIGAFSLAGMAQADLVADATAEIQSLKTSASAMGTPILAVVASIVLISVIVMLTKKAR